MFYVVMIIDLILIGVCLSLLYQLNQEGLVVPRGVVAPTKEKAIRVPKLAKIPKIPKPKKEKKKKGKYNVEEDISEDISWDNFGIVERDKGVIEEQREMDVMFGFETKKNDGLLERAKSDQPAQNKSRSLEEEFGDLFSEDEKMEITGSVDEPPINSKTKNNGFNDFSDFENFNIGDEDIKKESSNDEEVYDFLKNYDFDSSDKESIDDDIFDRARNRNNKESNQEDLEFNAIKDNSPPINKVNYEHPRNKGIGLDSSSNKNAVEDEDDDIFARLQRLSNMMDQQKK